jgi:hypothetical protein
MQFTRDKVDVAQLKMTFDRVYERSIESPCPAFAPLLAEKHCHVFTYDPAEGAPDRSRSDRTLREVSQD